MECPVCGYTRTDKEIFSGCPLCKKNNRRLTFTNLVNTDAARSAVKLTAAQGHGFAAERYNHQIDLKFGRRSVILGDDNAKNGPDRMVGRQLIQSKYCRSGVECVNACFKNGEFRYWTPEGKPMQIEVPSDMYDSALKSMEKRIVRGELKGITDPKQAKHIIRKGNITYAQAVNAAKFGTIDSLVYDAYNGFVELKGNGKYLGVSAVLTFAVAVYDGKTLGQAIRESVVAGINISTFVVAHNVLTAQLTKAGAVKLVNAARETVINSFGLKTVDKVFGVNVVSLSITVVLNSTGDLINIFKGRISNKQLLKNMIKTTGAAMGSVVGTTMCPGAGTIAGAVAAERITSKITDAFIDDDSKELLELLERRFAQLSTEYLLNLKEADIAASNLLRRIDGEDWQDMYADSNRIRYADYLIIPCIENVIHQRKHIYIPSEIEFDKIYNEIVLD